MNLTDFIAGLPKAELHVHHVGSAGPRIVSELAARHPGVVPSDPDELRSFFAFRDFAHFIEVYLAVVDLIRTPEDVRTLTYEVARDMTGQGLRYAELTCTPHTSVLRGIPIEAYTEAIEDARVAAERDFGLVLRWIYDIPGEWAARRRRHPRLRAAPRAGRARRLRPRRTRDRGPAAAVPAALRRRPRRRAPQRPHAGETTGPGDGVGRVRLLGAERIGHGIRAAQDPELLAHLAATASRSRCARPPTSPPARSRARRAPVRAFVDAGVPVTINSDDPPMFGTTLNREYAVAAELLDLDEAGVADLAPAAVARRSPRTASRTRLLARSTTWTARPDR